MMTDNSSAAMPGRAEFSVGGVLKRGFGVYFANIVPFTILALIFYLPSLLLTSARVTTTAGGARVGVGTSVHSWGGLAIFLLSTVLTYVLTGALVYGTVQHLNGRKAGIGEILGRGLSRIVPVVIIAILFSIAFGIGIVLLVVPGLFVLVIWSVAVPASVVERPGIFGAFGRSRELTKGYRWQVLGLLLIMVAIMLGFSFVTAAAAGVAYFAMNNLMPLLIVDYVISAISGALMSVVIAVLYHDLRVAKEGVSTAQIAAVFD